jgi:hypothetical protein
MVGHKMVLGMTMKLYIYPEGTPRPPQPRMEELGGTPRKVSNLPHFYPSEPFGFIQRGKPYVIEEEIEIFETDIPAQSMWGPESNKYKVLWQTTLRQIPKEERELPPEIREEEAQIGRMKPQPVPMPEISDGFLRTSSETCKRILATEITAGFQSAPLSSVAGYLSQQSKADIVLKLNSADAKMPSIYRGFDHEPLRAVLYEISRDTGLTVEWEFGQDSPARIVITDKRR